MRLQETINILLICATVFASTSFILLPLNTSSEWAPSAWSHSTLQKITTLFNAPALNSLPIAPTQPTIIATGDIMLSRTVASKIEEHGVHYPFAFTTEYLQNADITFGNLETAITPGRKILPLETTFRADKSSLSGLVASGFDVLSLANNHTPDFGTQGLLDTLQALDEMKLSQIGAGKNLKQASEIKYITVSDITFAWLAFNDTDVVPQYYGASVNRAGTNFMNVDILQMQVKKARAQADFVIISMHSGTEYVFLANQRQIDFAHLAVDAGADLVLGHHPHVIQNMEVYRDKLIFYSLGNFVFDQMWSEPTRESLMIKFTWQKNIGIIGIEIVPLKIQNYSQPIPVTGVEAQKIIDKLQIPPDLAIPVVVL